MRGGCMLPLKKRLPALLAFCCCYLFCFALGAKELYEYGTSIRALGMGNAYLGVVDDHDALFYNPASLTRIEGIRFTLLDLGGGVNGQSALDALTEYSNSSEEGVNRFQTLFGKQIWIGLGGKLAVTTPRFGVGIFQGGHVGFELKNPQLPEMKVDYNNDWGIVIGGAFKVGDEMSFGLNVKRINRTGGEGAFGVSQFLDGQTTNVSSGVDKRGVGYGADLGFLYRLEKVPFKPTIAASWKDVGYTTFIKETGYEAPPSIFENRSLGIAAGFDLFLIDMTAAIDFRNLTAPGEPLGKKAHLGLELGLPLIDVRVGFNQGYTTYGASLDFALVRFDLAYYSVEMGEYPGQDPDTRIQAQLVVDIGFDPSFKLMDIKGGRGRKLKQRR